MDCKLKDPATYLFCFFFFSFLLGCSLITVSSITLAFVVVAVTDLLLILFDFLMVVVVTDLLGILFDFLTPAVMVVIVVVFVTSSLFLLEEEGTEHPILSINSVRFGGILFDRRGHMGNSIVPGKYFFTSSTILSISFDNTSSGVGSGAKLESTFTSSKALTFFSLSKHLLILIKSFPNVSTWIRREKSFGCGIPTSVTLESSLLKFCETVGCETYSTVT